MDVVVSVFLSKPRKCSPSFPGFFSLFSLFSSLFHLVLYLGAGDVQSESTLPVLSRVLAPSKSSESHPTMTESVEGPACCGGDGAGGGGGGGARGGGW